MILGTQYGSTGTWYQLIIFHGHADTPGIRYGSICTLRSFIWELIWRVLWGRLLLVEVDLDMSTIVLKGGHLFYVDVLGVFFFDLRRNPHRARPPFPPGSDQE